MASSLPPVKGAAFTFDISLVSQASPNIFKTSVTIASGDITVSKDGGAFANITTLPTEIGTSGVLPVALSATEMNADRVTVRFHDAAGDEWQDALVTVYTAAQTLDTTDTAIDDTYARLGAPTGASISADIAAIEAQTDDIGVAGAGLTAVPWNAAWDAEVESEATDALNAYDPPTATELTNALNALNDITVADIIAGISEGSLDLQEMLRIMLAALAGKAAGGGTTTITFRDRADTKARITATVDANGNRQNVILDGS